MNLAYDVIDLPRISTVEIKDESARIRNVEQKHKTKGHPPQS